MIYHIAYLSDLKCIPAPDDGDIAIAHLSKYKCFVYDEEEDEWVRDEDTEVVVQAEMEFLDREYEKIENKED